VGTLKEAVVVVTGASRGLGAAIAEELGRGGAHVVVNYSRSKEPADEVVARIEEGGSRAIAVQADVSDPEEAQALIDKTIEEFNRIDVLVNNAGINIDRTLKKLSVEDWDKVIQVDLNSAFYTVHAALAHMMEQGGGKIINMSSFVGEAGQLLGGQSGSAGLHQDRSQGARPQRNHRERHLPRLHRDRHGRQHPRRGESEAPEDGAPRPLRPTRRDSPRRSLPDRGRRLHHRPSPRHKRWGLHKDLAGRRISDSRLPPIFRRGPLLPYPD
jgi:nucleoside-diphosphate-sugar epimerase